MEIAKSKAHYSGYVITAKVNVGKELKVYSPKNYSFRDLWKMGYDSVWAPHGSGSLTGKCERVIYNSDQIEIISITKL